MPPPAFLFAWFTFPRQFGTFPWSVPEQALRTVLCALGRQLDLPPVRSFDARLHRGSGRRGFSPAAFLRSTRACHSRSAVGIVTPSCFSSCGIGLFWKPFNLLLLYRIVFVLSPLHLPYMAPPDIPAPPSKPVLLLDRFFRRAAGCSRRTTIASSGEGVLLRCCRAGRYFFFSLRRGFRDFLQVTAVKTLSPTSPFVSSFTPGLTWPASEFPASISHRVSCALRDFLLVHSGVCRAFATWGDSLPSFPVYSDLFLFPPDEPPPFLEGLAVSGLPFLKVRGPPGRLNFFPFLTDLEEEGLRPALDGRRLPLALSGSRLRTPDFLPTGFHK